MLKVVLYFGRDRGKGEKTSHKRGSRKSKKKEEKLVVPYVLRQFLTVRNYLVSGEGS